MGRSAVSCLGMAWAQGPGTGHPWAVHPGEGECQPRAGPGGCHSLKAAPPTACWGLLCVTRPPPTESSVGAQSAQAAPLRAASSGPGAGGLPAVHGVGGHDAEGRHEPPREQLPGAGGHGAGAEAGDAACKRESGPRGGGGEALGPGTAPRHRWPPTRCRPRPPRRRGTTSPPCTTGWRWSSCRASSA